MPYAATVNLAAIDLPERLMRSDTTYEGLGELIEDIAQNGLINPISVRELPEGRYRLIAGRRRMLATIELGKLGITAQVYGPDEGDDDLIMGAENFQRTQVNSVEEAEFYAAQIVKYGISASEVARRYKRSASHVVQLLSVIEGDQGVLAALRDGKITKSQAVEINKFTDNIGKQGALTYALNNGMTAVSIKAWRESRERGGVSSALKAIEPVIAANGEMMMLTNLYCQFHKAYLPLDQVQTLQICNDCFSGIATALEFWTAHGHNQDEGQP